MNVSLQDRFRGCLLGVAVGDALGARFEAQSADYIRARLPTVDQLIDYDIDELWYTDDTQMTIGVAETLVAYGEVIEERLCRAFISNYDPSRGYGRGARRILDAMKEERDYQAAAADYFPGGSYGSGAAMRVAPVGLFFRDDSQALLAQSRSSALPTHLHPLGIEGIVYSPPMIGGAMEASRFVKWTPIHRRLSGGTTRSLGATTSCWSCARLRHSIMSSYRRPIPAGTRPPMPADTRSGRLGD